MDRLGDSEKSALKDVRVIIGTKEGDLQEARRLGFLKRLLQSATENVPTKVYVPIATFCATFLLQGGEADIKKAAINALAAVGATLLWILLDALLFKPSIKYSEV